VTQGRYQDGADAQAPAAGEIDAGIALGVLAEHDLAGADGFGGNSGVGLQAHSEVGRGAAGASAAHDFIAGAEGDGGAGRSRQMLRAFGDGADGRFQIKLAGMDLVPQALDLIEKKTNYIFSTGGHWLQVGFGVMIAYDKINGHNPIKTDIRLNLIGVNAANFDTFKKQFIDSSPPYDVKQYTLTNNPAATAQTFPLQTK